MLEKGSVGVSRDCPNFVGYLQLSQERIKLRTSNLASTFTGFHPNKTSLKILEKRYCGRIQGLPKFLGYLQLSQEQHQSEENALKISGKV